MDKPRKKRRPKNKKNDIQNVSGPKPPEENSPALDAFFSPAIEADFVLGNFLDEIFPLQKQVSDHGEALEAGDISDSAIEEFLKKHLPALRAEVDAVTTSKHTPPIVGDSGEDLADERPPSETLTPPPTAAQTQMDDLTEIDSGSSLEILYEINKLPPEGDALKPESFYDIIRSEAPLVITAPQTPPNLESDLASPSDDLTFPEKIEIFATAPDATDSLDAPSAETDNDSVENIFGLPPISEQTTTIFEIPPLPQAFTPLEKEQTLPAPALEPEPIPLHQKAQILSRAISWYREQKYDDAILELKQLLKIDPEYALAHKILGNAYFKNRMYSEALASYEQYKKKQPGDLSVHENLGIVYSRLGVLQLAIKEWQALLQSQPDRPDLERRIRRARAILDAETQKPPAVNERLRLLNDGIQHYKNKNYQRAIEAFRQALIRYSDSVEVYSFLGNAYFRNQMLTEAAKAFEKVKRMDSAYVPAYENMAVIYAHQGAYDQALREWEKVIKLNPNRNDVQEKIKKTIQKLRDTTPLHPAV